MSWSTSSNNSYHSKYKSTLSTLPCSAASALSNSNLGLERLSVWVVVSSVLFFRGLPRGRLTGGPLVLLQLWGASCVCPVCRLPRFGVLCKELSADWLTTAKSHADTSSNPSVAWEEAASEVTFSVGVFLALLVLVFRGTPARSLTIMFPLLVRLSWLSTTLRKWNDKIACWITFHFCMSWCNPLSGKTSLTFIGSEVCLSNKVGHSSGLMSFSLPATRDQIDTRPDCCVTVERERDS